MNPDNQQPPQLSPQTNPTNSGQPLQDMNFPLKVMQPGEQVLAHIKPHPIGLVGPVCIAALFLILVFGGAAYTPHVVTDMTQQMKNVLFIVATLLAVLDLLFLWIATMIYNGNQWVVTSDSITQISQTGLFFKRTSQMSFENLEDVTFSQKGLIPMMLDFGALSAETAGNHSKFVFRYCPTPQKYATQIIAAHEEFMRHQENPTALFSENNPYRSNPTPVTHMPSSGPDSNQQ